ncbi:transmembrane signal receptor [Lithospermum erythrorhizon]|uniref:non-specific serine/threonine protein kinase n=1 Tax=Lithospermum erythrorhizon TaxID=34254 RepID=A0AAV3PQU4_LITER
MCMVLSWKMAPRVWLCILALFLQVLLTTALTDAEDAASLLSLKESWANVPSSWVGSDPCGGKWGGISCLNSRVVSITLSSIGLSGSLSGDIGNLVNLQTLDLSYNKGLSGNLPASVGNLKKLTNLILVGCNFGGPIPESIGHLDQLVFLSLNSNNFIEEIPDSMGLLSQLYWLDIADNELTGSIPVSNGRKPGLDMLLKTKHFHFGNNRLTGEIPAQLFTSNMSLIHLLLENNLLSGSIPDTVGLVSHLEVVRLDNNSFSGSVPATLNKLTNVTELFLSNNRLTGNLPNLTGMGSLNYLDMSNNTFDPSDFPSWFPTLQSLTTLVMEGTRIQGQLPNGLFSLPQLQTVKLRSNKLNGTLDVGSSYSSQLQLIDLRDNGIDAIKQRARSYGFQIILDGNRICYEGGTNEYCTSSQPSNSSYSTLPDNCLPAQCSNHQVSSRTCKCAYPYTGTLYFRAPSFSNLENSTYYEILQESMMKSFQSHQMPIDSLTLSTPTKNFNSYLVIGLQIFPSSGYHFNLTGVVTIGFLLSNQTFKPPKLFGPYFFIGDCYKYFDGVRTDKSKGYGIIIGAAVGGSILLILAILAGVFAFRQKKKAEEATLRSNPFASWNKSKHSDGVPQMRGPTSFSFEELKKYTNNFSDVNDVGSGGYGKVYRGMLPNGQFIAIKRAHNGSMQGALEFKTEIELLSRVHHKNLVRLHGICFEQGEQMLIYEYCPNGTVKDSLSGKSGIRLDWPRRLRIALGVARGIQYLHDLADPPIIHRDIKSNNVLLDDCLTAKVSDFGLSKLAGEHEIGHVSTQVKGTMGYLDPEYYMTQQLTEKSDVYSFGVLLLELITARNPIENRKYIVTEVKQQMDTTKELYGLQGILDPKLDSSMTPKSLEKFVDLSLRCVENTGADRPSMSEVVKEIENIMELAGLNPNVESTSTSENYKGGSKQSPYVEESPFAYSGGYLPSKLEPK